MTTERRNVASPRACEVVDLADDRQCSRLAKVYRAGCIHEHLMPPNGRTMLVCDLHANGEWSCNECRDCREPHKCPVSLVPA